MPRNKGTSRKGKPKRHDRDAGMGRSLARAQGGGGGGKPKRTHATHPGGGMMSAGAASIGIDTPSSTGEGAIKMKSVLETDDLTDFLHRAEMAGREFEVERGGFVVVDETAGQVVPQQERREQQQGQQRRQRQPEFRHVELSVPRRPKWDESTTPDELHRLENEAFLEWRRAIAVQEEALYHASSHEGNDHSAAAEVVVTPFEKNLEVWRQLWRVLERCDVLVLIVDARNPLFYLSDDLRKYAESELGKPMVVLVNKSDHLTAVQRGAWHDYLVGKGVEHMFFSAYMEQLKLDERAAATMGDPPSYSGNAEEEEEKTRETTDTADDDDDVGVESPLTRAQLRSRLLHFARSRGCVPSSASSSSARYGDRIQFGTVGFPNVGKSSAINVLVGSSKRTHGETSRVAVASQPGKTKHFQTVLIPDCDSMMLCDCPGLVFPSLVRGGGSGGGDGRADLIAAGVYPIAQMRDARAVVELICRRIPRAILAAHYGIRLPPPSSEGLGSGSSTASNVSAEELLDSYCEARSLLTAASSNYDHQAASRVIVRDYVDGRLLYCHPPPLPGVGGGGGGRSGDEDADTVFLRETILTALRRTERLGKRLMNDGAGGGLASPKIANGGSGGDDDGHGVNPLEVKDDDDEGGDSGLSPQVDDVDLDLDILDVLAGGDGGGDGHRGIGADATDRAATTKKGNRHKSIRKHGKKGRKDRDKDPYGCHTGGDADSFLREAAAADSGRNAKNKNGKSGGRGVIVNAGKYGGAGYTRPTGYAGARSAVSSNSGRDR